MYSTLFDCVEPNVRILNFSAIFHKGGDHFESKKLCCRFWTYKQGFLSMKVEKKLHYDCPKIPPFWRRHPSQRRVMYCEASELYSPINSFVIRVFFFWISQAKRKLDNEKIKHALCCILCASFDMLWTLRSYSLKELLQGAFVGQWIDFWRATFMIINNFIHLLDRASQKSCLLLEPNFPMDMKSTWSRLVHVKNDQKAISGPSLVAITSS